MRIPRSISLQTKNSFHLIWKMHNGSFLLKDKESKRLYLRCVHEDLMKNTDTRKNSKHSLTKPLGTLSTREKAEKSKLQRSQKNIQTSAKKGRRSNVGFDLHGYCVMGNHIHSFGTLNSDTVSLSKHLQKAHSRFASKLNKKLDRSGAVGNDRPKSIPVENYEGQIRLALYIFTNPIRARMAKNPWDIKLRHMSSCRVFTHGESSEFSGMIVLPSWYLALGKTAKERQSKFRELLRIYLIENGLMRDPKFSEGLFIGSEEWGKKILACAKEYCRRKRKKKLEMPALE